MQPIKILHLIESLARGGAEQQLIYMVDALREAQIEHVIVVLGAANDFADDIKAKNLSVIFLEQKGWLGLLRAIPQVCTLVYTLKPDLIQTWTVVDRFVGRMTAIFTCTPIISSVHSPMYARETYTNNPHQKAWKMFIVRMIDAITAKVSRTHIVGCSKYVTHITSQALRIPAQHTTTIYNGIPTESFPDWDHPVESAQLLHIGRLVPPKNQRTLLQAMPLILQKHSHVHLYIAGEGHLRAALECQIHDLGIEHAVTLLGFRHDIPQLLQKHSVCILPSVWEGQPLAALEALATGIPVVGSDIPAMREIMQDQHYGILIPAQDYQGLAAAVIALLDHPEQAYRMSAAARAYVREHFTIERAAQQWVSLYRTLLS